MRGPKGRCSSHSNVIIFLGRFFFVAPKRVPRPVGFVISGESKQASNDILNAGTHGTEPPILDYLDNDRFLIEYLHVIHDGDR